MSAIVLGADTPIGLTVIRELGEHGVAVHAVGRTPQALGFASRWCRSHSVRPKGPLADWIGALIAAQRPKVLLAISEHDLVALAELPAEIDGCRILTPRAAPLDLVLDKSATLRAASAVGIDVPESWQPEAGEDVAARAAALVYPVIVKWANPPAVTALLDAHGLALEKAEFADDAAGLFAILERYRPMGMWPLVQTYCKGVGLGQMLHMKDGRATLRFQHRRLHEWPPEGGTSTLCAGEPLDRHREQMTRSEALLRAIGWEGPAMVEYRYDAAAGRYWLMEINGRFWGSLPLARASGAAFAWETYRCGLGEAGGGQQVVAGRRARYMIPETRRLLKLLTFARSRDPYFRSRPFVDLASYVLGFVDPRSRYYVFTLSDPRPFFADLWNGVRKLLRRGSAG